jgi:SAM-dependent methyltransferase
MKMNYCNPEGFRNEIKELLEKGDMDAFYHWFDGGDTVEGAFKKGADVFNRVIKPYADKYLKGQRHVALDLGYGMGTKIKAALNTFPRVYGVDVHEEWEVALHNMELEENQEIKLLWGDGRELPLEDQEINFVYSWVTFCHLGTIENVEKYLQEIFRVLKPGGVAVLFFTRLIRTGRNQTWEEVEADMALEKIHNPGYREGGPESKVRSINLVMSMWKMEELSSRSGFDILEKTASWDNTKKGKVFHGQYGIVLRRPVESVSTSPVGNSTEESSAPSESTSPPPKKKKTLKKTLVKEKKSKKPALKRSK